MKDKLVKSRNKVIAGVCGGIADYIGMDAAWIRVLYAVVSIFSFFMVGMIIYLILWFIMPEPGPEPEADQGKKREANS